MTITYEAADLPNFALRADAVRMPLHANGELEVRLIRRVDFEEPVTLRVEGLPGGVTAAEVTIPEGEEHATIRLVADGSLRKLAVFPLEIVGTAGPREFRTETELEVETDVIPPLPDWEPPVPIRFASPDEPVTITLTRPLVVEGNVSKSGTRASNRIRRPPPAERSRTRASFTCSASSSSETRPPSAARSPTMPSPASTKSSSRRTGPRKRAARLLTAMPRE